MALTDNLVGVWCESATITADLHTNGLTLTNNGTVTTTTGKVGTAGDFEEGSTQSLTRADEALLSIGINTDFTITGWCRPENLFDTLHPIISKCYGAANNDTEYEVYGTNGDMVFQVWGSSGSGNPVSVTKSGVLVTATWLWFAAWYDSVADLLHLDTDNSGTSVSAACTLGAVDRDNVFGIGRRPADGKYYDGLLNQIALWKRMLTAPEKTQLYNSGNGLAYSLWVPVALPLRKRKVNQAVHRAGHF